MGGGGNEAPRPVSGGSTTAQLAGAGGLVALLLGISSTAGQSLVVLGALMIL